MAPRLTVIISQAAVGTGAACELEESLIAQLLMSPGFDATLVGPLERLEPDSTDHLCISGFNHNVALVSWLDPKAVAQHWQRLGLTGSIRPVGQAPQASMAQERSIYCVQLTERTRTEDVTQQLDALLRERSVKTVGITLPVLPQRAAGRTIYEPISAESKAPATLGERSPLETAIAASRADMDRPPTSGLDSGAPSGNSHDTDDLSDAEWASLEQLVDDFDSLDL